MSDPAQDPRPFQPRPAQARILEYTGGPMGVSAVPGSGKTFTLSLLAARLVDRLAREERMTDREVLVVTFTNSAVENFRARINSFVRQEQGLLPGVGYRVRTLHGLAHDIVRERPSLVGLSESFEIVDDRTSDGIVSEAVHAYLQTHPDLFGAYLLPDYLANQRRIERYLLDDALEIANNVIRVGKELRMGPEVLRAQLTRQSGSWPLLDFGLRIYADYQRSLQARGGVDFADLIGLALQALDADEQYLARLQERWPYVLEDEAQDSSLLQEEMLRRLTNRHGNWVRVGDPNQAINTTFTSADTRFLQNFIARYAQQARSLPNSGRSAQPIMDLANHLAHWSRTEHPVLPPDLVLALPQIEPTPDGDPQPNPSPGSPPVFVYNRAMTPQEEIDLVVTSMRRWLPENETQTAAILVPDNARGDNVRKGMEEAKLPFDDSLLRSNSAARVAAKALADTLAYITQPQNPTHLERLWLEVWWPRRGIPYIADPSAIPDGADPATRPSAPSVDSALPEPVITFGRALARANQPETFLFPSPENSWLDTLSWLEETPGFREAALAFQSDLRRWTQAVVLPVDELILTLSGDLFSTAGDLALAHHLALLLAKLGRENPTWRLPELGRALDEVVNNRRRIPAFSEDAAGYTPRPGQVAIATIHGAKGLEWDRVILLSVNGYSFPSGTAEEQYRGQRWYVRENLNLVAESIEQLAQLARGSLDGYQPGPASAQARLDMAAERLRLLYVGITRARREVILTYNTGRQAESRPLPPAVAFTALGSFLNGAETVQR